MTGSLSKIQVWEELLRSGLCTLHAIGLREAEGRVYERLSEKAGPRGES